MGISMATNLGAGVLGVNTVSIAGSKNRLKDGASVKDVMNETKDKFTNSAKTAGKAGAVLAGAGGAGALIGAEIGTGIISKHLPKSATALVEKAANSTVTKQLAGAASELLTKAGGFVKAHPIACAALLAVGTVGQLLFNNILKEGAKNEGKIEQKYDDIIALKNSTTDILA